MSKKRKLHQLKGVIKYRLSGQNSAKSLFPHQPFYVLEIYSENLFRASSIETVYVFPNLVSEEIWKVLESRNYQNKKYLFFCERRVRGWRLKDMQEINSYDQHK